MKKTQQQKKAAARANGNRRRQTQNRPAPLLARELPNLRVNAGDKSSNRMAAANGKLVAASELTAMSPTNINRLLSDFIPGTNSVLYKIARLLVHKLCTQLPNDCSSSDSATTWSPTGVLQYLVWALFSSLRDSGTFSQPAMVNAFPPFPADGFIPVAWAQVLSYLKPFKGPLLAMQIIDTVLTALPTPPTNNIVGPGGNQFATDLVSESAAHPWTAASGVEAAISAGTGTSWANVYLFVQNLSATVARGLNCCRYSDIPAQAPDASAYAANAQTATWYSVFCPTPMFEPEITVCLITSFNNAQEIPMPSYVKPIPAFMGYASLQYWWVENFQYCSFIPGGVLTKTLKTHAWNQADFVAKRTRFGRIRVKANSRYKGGPPQPVRFLLGSTINIDPRSFQALIPQVLAATTINGASAANLAIVALAMMCSFVAKLLPYSYEGGVGSVASTAFDPRFKNMELPLALASVLNSIGPIVVDGRMCSPYLYTVAADLRGGWLRYSTVGTTVNAETLFNCIWAGTNTTNLGPAPFSFTAAAYPTTTNYGATPLTSADLFMAAVNSAFTGAGVNPSPATMIKPDSHNPVGKANMLVFADVVVDKNNANAFVFSGITSCTTRVGAVGSYKLILGDELGLAVVCPLVYPVSSQSTVSTIAALNMPYRASMTSVNRTSGLQVFAQECNVQSINQGVGNALATIRRQTVEKGGSTIDVSQNGDILGQIADIFTGGAFSDFASDGIKSLPLATIAGTIIGGPAGAAVGAAVDSMGITDGIVSSFGQSASPTAAPSSGQSNKTLFAYGGKDDSFSKNILPIAAQFLGGL